MATRMPAAAIQTSSPRQIAFLAISEAHQIFHWLPAALRLAQHNSAEVSVLSPSRQMLDFISTFDPEGVLKLVKLKNPRFARESLFRMPSRLAVLLLNYRRIASFRFIATTEVSSAHLQRFPSFSSKMIHLKHGAGDREGGYNPRHSAYDLTLVMGEKDRERLIARGLATPENCKVTGYSKFELMAPGRRFFDNDKPVILYNPHFDKQLSPWSLRAEEILNCFSALTNFNFIVAPHVKSTTAVPIKAPSPNIRIDPGSRYSIDMTYANSADMYLGDISSQVYEFILKPRPCLFLNLSRIPWQAKEQFVHWRMGQVVENLSELQVALESAARLQPSFEDIQKQRLVISADIDTRPASERQAEAISQFMDNNS